MLIANTHPDHGRALDPTDVETFSTQAADLAERLAGHRPNYAPTPLHALPALARSAGVASVHIKDEGQRFGMGSFKALGGYYAVVRLVLEEASKRFGRQVDVSELSDPALRSVAQGMTFGCATDGNHGKSVAAGATAVGARSVIFVHEGVTDERVAAIAGHGAEVIRVRGTYDDSLKEAERACCENGWTIVSDTSWPSYERIPNQVMQGYTVMLREIVSALPQPPSHVFVQAGVGGLAAAVAAYFDNVYGSGRPTLIVVEPERAACLYESAKARKLVKVDHAEPTIMAMLECYEPSMTAWRILSRKADAFLTVDEAGAVDAMRRLARPMKHDPAIVAGESGAAGLAGFLGTLNDRAAMDALHIGTGSRILLINTEWATDRARYCAFVGMMPEAVAGSPACRGAPDHAEADRPS